MKTIAQIKKRITELEAEWKLSQKTTKDTEYMEEIEIQIEVLKWVLEK